MADPLKQICDKLGVSKEEALFYLEGFGWDLTAAMESCRSKTLPPSENERAAAEERSKKERAAAEERNKNERDAAEEISRNDMIDYFLQTAIGSSTADANKYLRGTNWNIVLAVDKFYEHTENNSNPLSRGGNTETWYPAGTEGSDLMEDVLSKVPQFHNASMDLRSGSSPSASTPPLELKEEIINEFRKILPVATPQEAINCLNKCEGNVVAAVNYFIRVYSKSRSGIATAQVVKNFSGRTVDRDSSTESPQVEESGNPTETLPLKEEETSEVKEEHIGSFVKMTEASREDAIANLEYFKWDVNQAVKFFEEYGYTAEEISGLRMSLMENRDLNLPSNTASSVPTKTQKSPEEAGEGSDLMQDLLSKVPQFHNLRSPPSASTPPFELKQESIEEFHKVASDASRTAVIDCLNHCKGNVAKAVAYFYDVYSKAHPSEAVKEELLTSFSSTTGAARQVANVYLEKYNWNIDRATNFFFDHRDSEPEEQTSMGLMENRDLPLPSLGLLPSQSQFESSYVSSVPTETLSSPEEAGEGDDTVDDDVEDKDAEEDGEGDVTVAIPPGMASSQVDGKAVEEGSTVETQAAPSSIMITIRLADRTGTELELPFRLNQTIRDIHNAIDEQYPDHDRGYYLQSMDGVAYKEGNRTVQRVSRGDSTMLIQTFP